MADNLAVTPGSGATMAADEATDGTLGSVKVPFAKIMDGTLDSTNKLVINSSGEALVNGTANTQPVSAASLPLPTGAATAANQSTGNTSLSNIDTNAGATSDAAATAGSTGTISAKLRRISADIDSVKTSVSSLDGKTTAVNTGSVTVGAALPAGTNIVGKFTTDQTTHGTTDLVAADITKINGTAVSATNPLPGTVTDGTNTANVLKSDGTAADQNAQMVAGTGYSTSTLTLNAGSPNTAWYDLLNYPWYSVEILTNTAPATLTFQTSGDSSQTNIASTAVMSAANIVLSNTTTTTSATGNFIGPRTGRYFRISSNVSGGNTVTLVITFYTTSPTPIALSQTQVGSNSATGSAVPANAFMVGASDGTNLLALRTLNPSIDGLSGSGSGNLAVAATGILYNGSTFDRARTVAGAGTAGSPTGVLATSLATVINNNGLLKSKTIAAASTNATSVKNGAGNLYTLEVTNSDTVGYYVKLYNKASAPTVGTDVPVATYYAPPGGGFVLHKPSGSPYTTGIALATTLLATDADTTVVTNANKLVINLEYV